MGVSLGRESSGLLLRAQRGPTPALEMLPSFEDMLRICEASGRETKWTDVSMPDGTIQRMPLPPVVLDFEKEEVLDLSTVPHEFIADGD